MTAIRDRFRQVTNWRRWMRMRDIREVIEELNPILLGWGTYYRAGNASRHFGMIDRYVRHCLIRLLRHRRRHQGRGRDNRPVRWIQEWMHDHVVADFGLYELLGTIRCTGASHAARERHRQAVCGKPRARFVRGSRMSRPNRRVV
jgi:RNA-directed DNA polymerase